MSEMAPSTRPLRVVEETAGPAGRCSLDLGESRSAPGFSRAPLLAPVDGRQAAGEPCPMHVREAVANSRSPSGLASAISLSCRPWVKAWLSRRSGVMVNVEIAMSMRPDEVAAKKRLEAEILDLERPAGQHLLGDGAHEVDLEALGYSPALVLDLPTAGSPDKAPTWRVWAAAERGGRGEVRARRECAKHGLQSCVPLSRMPLRNDSERGAEDVYYGLAPSGACLLPSRCGVHAPLSVSTRFGRVFLRGRRRARGACSRSGPPALPTEMDRVLRYGARRGLIAARRAAIAAGLRGTRPLLSRVSRVRAPA